MKKLIFFPILICLIFVGPVNAQKSGLLKKVTKSMTNELLGKPQEGSNNNNAM